MKLGLGVVARLGNGRGSLEWRMVVDWVERDTCRGPLLSSADYRENSLYNPQY